jgi:hypothetical protein
MEMRTIEDGHGVAVSDAAPARSFSASRREGLLGAVGMTTVAALTTSVFSANADEAALATPLLHPKGETMSTVTT